MAPFQPKGSRALRVIITEMAAQASYGDVLTFTDLARAIEVQPDGENGRAQVRQAVSAARPLLLADHGRALVAVRGKGYRVALPGELAGIAQDHRRRGNVQFGKALAVVEQGSTRDMSPAELRRFQALGVVIRDLNARVNATEERLSDLENVVSAIISGKAIPATVDNT